MEKMLLILLILCILNLIFIIKNKVAFNIENVLLNFLCFYVPFFVGLYCNLNS